MESQDFHDLPCTKCTRDNKHVASVKYCVECTEYFCDSCLKQHNSFAMMSVHSLLDKDSKPVHKLMPANSITEKCVNHHLLLELFCAEHDVVCCRTCVAIEHSSCESIHFVLRLANGMKKDPKVKKVKDDMQAAKTELGRIRKARKNDRKRIEKEKQTAITKIKDFKKKLNKHLDDMEEKSLASLERKHKLFEDRINTNIDQLDNMIKHLDAKIKLLDGNCGDNESQLFINVKQGKNVVGDGNKLSKEVMIGFEHIKFCEYTNLYKEIQEYDRFGYICHKKVNVKVPTDEKTCQIQDSCQLEDNTILIIDKNNDKLKRLDKVYEVKDWVHLTDHHHGFPTGVCSIGPQEVAVSLSRKIQFVSVGDKMSLTKSFHISEVFSGLVYSNNELFVCCNVPFQNHGFYPHGLHDEYYQVRVYGTSGQHLRTLNKAIKYGLYYNAESMYITVSADGSSIYVIDYYNGIIALDRQGNVIAKHTNSNLQLNHPRGICMDDKDHLIVCGYESNNVIQVNKDGTNPRVLLGQSDGIRNPHSVCIDRNNHRVLVFSPYTDNVNVYDLV